MAFFEGIKMTGGYGNGPDIINSCSVDVNRGEIVSILGPNGAGKSTNESYAWFVKFKIWFCSN